MHTLLLALLLTGCAATQPIWTEPPSSAKSDTAPESDPPQPRDPIFYVALESWHLIDEGDRARYFLASYEGERRLAHHAAGSYRTRCVPVVVDNDEEREPNPPQFPPGLVLGRVNCIDMGRRFYFLRQGSSLVLIRVLSRADARPIEVARIAVPENRKLVITATSIAELARCVYNGSRWRIYCPRADGCIIERNGRSVVSERSRSSLEHSRRGRWLALRFQHITGRNVQVAYLVDLGTARVYQLELPRDAIGQLAVVGAPNWVDGPTAWAGAPPCELFFDTETEGEPQRRVFYTLPPSGSDATSPIAPARIAEP